MTARGLPRSALNGAGGEMRAACASAAKSSPSG
jgi:hypothetical protein